MIDSARNKMPWYLLLLAAHLGLVWVLPYLPTQDGPSHIYNLVILQDLLNGGKAWGNVFTYQLDAVPNLGFNLLAYPLLKFFSPPTVEKCFFSIYIVLMGISVPYFLKTFGRPWLPLSYLVFPVIFSFPILMGFYSFAVAVPLFLLAFSYAWKISDQSAWFRFLYLNIAGCILFYFHIIAFLLYLLSLVAISLGKCNGLKKKLFGQIKLMFFLSPVLANFFLYLRQWKNPSPVFDYLLSAPRFYYLLNDLYFFSTVNFYRLQALPAAILLFLVSVLGYVSLKDAWKRRLRSEKFPPSEQTLIYLSLILVALYFLAPFNFGVGSCFNQRLPQTMLIVSLPLLKTPRTMLFRRFATVILAGLAGIYLLSNVIVLGLQSAKVAEFLSGMRCEMPKGSFLLALKNPIPAESRIDVLLHAASHYALRKGCVDVGNYEAVVNLFPVHYKKPFPTMPSISEIESTPLNIEWRNYPSINYLISWQMDGDQMKGNSAFFDPFWSREPLSIWKRKAD
jgi:hypothetical protein